MPIKTAKVEKHLKEVDKKLQSLVQEVNMQIQTLNNSISSKEENYSDLGFTTKEKDEKVETYKHNIEHGSQEVQNLQQQVEDVRNKAVAESQRLQGKMELYRELLDLSD